MKTKIFCSHCGKEFEKDNSAINRAVKNNLPMYCDRECFGLSHRTTKSVKVEKKRIYDIEYRELNQEKIKKTKSEYNKKTYNPALAAIERKKNMHRHVEYCRQPEYKEKKRIYDREFKAKKDYGELWEIQLLTLKIEEECLSQMSRYQINLESNTLNKTQKRKRHEQRINSEKFKGCPLGRIDQR